MTNQLADETGFEFYSYYVDPITTDGQCSAKGNYYPKSAFTDCPKHATKALCIADSACTYNEPYPGNNKYFLLQTAGPTMMKRSSSNYASFSDFTLKECNNFCRKTDQCFGIYYIKKTMTCYWSKDHNPSLVDNPDSVYYNYFEDPSTTTSMCLNY